MDVPLQERRVHRSGPCAGATRFEAACLDRENDGKAAKIPGESEGKGWEKDEKPWDVGEFWGNFPFWMKPSTI